MIVSFSVSNFRSFASEETLSLVASKRLSAAHRDHTVRIPDSDEEALKVAVLYGANGAGKSNLLKALKYLSNVALKPRKKSGGTGRVRFGLGRTPNKVSSFDLQFITEGKLYRYGFKVDDERILEEWLVRVVRGKEIPIYERVSDSSGKVTIEAAGLKKSDEKLKALITVGGPQNQSFLATVQATLNPPEIHEDVANAIAWFKDGLKLIAPDSPFGALGHMMDTDSRFLEFAGEFLKSSSTGVSRLQLDKKELTESELSNLLPKEVVSKVLEEVNENSVGIMRLADGKEVTVEKTDQNHYYLLNIKAAHEQNAGKTVTFDLKDESDGTRRLLNLMPALHFLKTDSATFFIDEIDRSMHPVLVWKFLEFFLKSCQGDGRQIIVTTHESNLLDLELLRRDEIWFAEKDAKGATRLYSMADFKVRNDLQIRKHYLEGRFGAVPFLGNLDQLLAEKEC